MIELVAGLAAGPAFLALLGPAGTGKTWLLQAAAADLRRRGQPAILIRRGELPFEVVPGTAVLVDEAARMDDERLLQLAGVRDASIVLADLPAFATRLGRLARPPAIVSLAPLPSEDMPGFAEAWLASRSVPAGVLTQPAVARLFDHSGGVPRLVVQLLRAALAMSGQMGAARIGADEVDEVAALRLGGFDAATARTAMQDMPADPAGDLATANPEAAGAASACAPAVLGAAPAASTTGASVRPWPRLRLLRAAAVLSALAASLLIAAVLGIRNGQHLAGDRGTILAASKAGPPGEGVVPDARAAYADDAAGALTHPVRTPATAAVPQAQEEAASQDLPGSGAEAAAAVGQEPAAEPFPGQAAAAAMPAPGPAEPVPSEAAAQIAVPPAPHPAEPAAIPSLTVTAPAAAPPAPEDGAAPLSAAPEPLHPGQGGGAPGLVLVAHPGDTMPVLYAKVYRGVRPPPYADVVAANHVPLRPGAIVVFPAPQDGWSGR